MLLCRYCKIILERILLIDYIYSQSYKSWKEDKDARIREQQRKKARQEEEKKEDEEEKKMNREKDNKSAFVGW